ncbi:hypothetical protein DI392_08165 [Vibrio albus]|uniref:Uncharacterized protein n=2 Tax=Vibrio albus TaxID=2200953 RepID=A0A2U3BBH7_9VIBR|nr:hypothetical protein DI392_08165 [Vibrio albus]
MNRLQANQTKTTAAIIQSMNSNDKNQKDLIQGLSESNSTGKEIKGSLDEIKCLLDENCNPDGTSGGPPTASASCGAPFSCSGDAIQCEQLRLQYEESCIGDELTQFEQSLNQITQVDNVEMLVDEQTIDLSEIDTSYLGSNGVSVSGSCPASRSLGFSMAGYSFSHSLDWSPFCDFLEGVRPFIVAFGWITGLLLIGRTQGGV